PRLRRQPAARPRDRQADRRHALARFLVRIDAALAAHLVQFRRHRGVARRTDAVAELRIGVLRDVALNLLPVLIVAADALAVAADRQQPVELLDAGQRNL